MQVGFETSSRLLLLCRRVVVPAQFALTEYHIIGVPLVCGDRVHPQYSTAFYFSTDSFRWYTHETGSLGHGATCSILCHYKDHRIRISGGTHHLACCCSVTVSPASEGTGSQMEYILGNSPFVWGNGTSQSYSGRNASMTALLVLQVAGCAIHSMKVTNASGCRMQ